MTKKNYVVIANCIRKSLQAERNASSCVKNTQCYVLIDLAYDLACNFFIDNALFSPSKFFNACGITSTELQGKKPITTEPKKYYYFGQDGVKQGIMGYKE
jgi:hypothetical protein